MKDSSWTIVCNYRMASCKGLIIRAILQNALDIVVT